ncbi:putative Alpha-1,3/1,6-mannosyltransferase ALG2 [Blattamonas nauphoetae]|uniref:Alpha-1,3/1,6-mannosyltransferase ALG2 n=1 Tax=Blattamonas nauphoetae TaxID=2049346 RepID=A0ABQ9YKF0_9EUKA|nr:putative Alpha-1,3/1,6-mannosyltransferase ALG2 [Blattamonas nauphoetae]
MSKSTKSLRIALVHPEMIIGGAERLMLDLGIGLQNHGHKVDLYAGYLNKNSVFPEVLDDNPKTTFSTRIYGNWIPRSFFGKFHALLAIVRMIYLSLCLCVLKCFHKIHYDLVICDTVAPSIPFLRLLGCPVFFYCHFPDRFLSQPSKNPLKRVYRAAIDFFDAFSMGKATKIAVNSKFTQSKFKLAFPKLNQTPMVLYPPVNVPAARKQREEALNRLNSGTSTLPEKVTSHLADPTKKTVFVSINRFESKKNLQLALDAFYAGGTDHTGFIKPWHLVFAGGYNSQTKDNVETLKKLQTKVKDLNIEDSVTFMTNITNEQKAELLTASRCCIYTPSDEHFGIVPVEAMAFQCPVVAVNSGGPMESIVDRVTGFLVPPNAAELGAVLSLRFDDDEAQREMGKNGLDRADKIFGLDTFGNEINNIVVSLCSTKSD